MAVLIAIGWLGWRAFAARNIAIASIPARPDLSGWSPILAARLQEAEESARGFGNATAGVAELSRLYHANGFLLEASQCYNGLRELESSNARWPHLLASIVAGYGRLDEAKPLLETALRLAPDYIPARLRLAEALLKSNDLIGAAAAYADVLRREPGNPYAELGLARCSIENGDWTGARERLQKAVTGRPDTFGGWALLVAIHEHFGDREALAAARPRAAAAGRFREMPDPWLDELTEDCYDPYRLSVAAALTTDSARARRWIERAIELSPDTGSYHRQLAILLQRTRDYPAARRHFERAAALNPADSDAWAHLVGLLKDMRNPAAADQALANGLAHCPESPALRHLNGQRLRLLGHFDAARAELELA
ncbi:MAG TPA: tetratricopeptide repeat protein, partial [Opitutus sp.]|nr:tetratricopeptide repeat protein [Opitutus sp.]